VKLEVGKLDEPVKLEVGKLDEPVVKLPARAEEEVLGAYWAFKVVWNPWFKVVGWKEEDPREFPMLKEDPREEDPKEVVEG
jgi:hypothetical protein